MKLSRRVIIYIGAGVLIIALIAVVSLTVLANTTTKATPTPAFSRRFFNTRTPTEVLTATETPLPTGTFTPTATMTPTPTDTPQPTATSEVTFKLMALSSPVTLNQGGVPAFVKVLTSPGATCNLSFQGPNSKIYILSGTGVTQADVNGVCSWYWTIPGGLPTGAATVTITVNTFGLSFPMILK